MRYNSKPILYVVLVIAVLLAASAVYMKYGSGPVQAAGCGMSSCPMNSTESTTGDQTSHDSTAGTQGITLSGSVVSVDRAQHKVLLRINAPYSDVAGSALSKVKAGDQVTATISFDKSGAPVVTGIAQMSGQTVTLGITGIQCQACVDRLQTSLKSVAGVKNVKVTANPARATITYDPATTSLAALKDAIRNTEPIHAGMPFGVVE